MDDFDRLLSEQHIAIQETEEKLSKLRQFSKDYEELKLTLNDVSKYFTKPAILPFSKKALVPGFLIHTNEVLVYLGGHVEHFAEMSTYQASSLIDKRIIRLDKNIHDLQEQHKLLTDREMFTSQLAHGKSPSNVGLQENSDEVEIREEYDSEKEKEWLQCHKNNLHRQRVSKAKHNLRKVRFDCSKHSSSSDSDAKYTDCCTIKFKHSNVPAKHVVSDVVNWSSASPSDVTMHFQKLYANSSNIFTSSNIKFDKSFDNSLKMPIPKPFSDIYEHTDTVTHNTEITQSFNRPLSKFRALRNQQK